MIVVYQRSHGSLTYRAIAKWRDGEWIEGADRMTHVPDEEAADPDLLLDRFGGPGNCTAIQVDDPADAPDEFDIPAPDPADEPADADDVDVPTIELDGIANNWMDPDRRPDNDEPPEDPVKPLEEMTADEIRKSFSNKDRAERVIQQLRDSDEDTVV